MPAEVIEITKTMKLPSFIDLNVEKAKDDEIRVSRNPELKKYIEFFKNYEDPNKAFDELTMKFSLLECVEATRVITKYYNLYKQMLRKCYLYDNELSEDITRGFNFWVQLMRCAKSYKLKSSAGVVSTVPKNTDEAAKAENE